VKSNLENLEMTNAEIAASSPALKARIAGIVYLINGMTYGYADGNIHGKILVAGNAAATAHNILANGSVLRTCFAVELISTVCYVVVTLLLYDLLKPVNRSISLLAAFFSLVGCVVAALASLFTFAPLIVMGGAPYLSVFKVEQLQALALLFLELHVVATSICMVFFGFYCLLVGYLIFRSIFMPRIIGVFMAITGLTYQLFLSPPLSTHLFPYVIKPAGALGELSLLLWLIIFGVNSQRWKEQAGASSTIG
jgi:hypothetical protein